MMMNRRILLYKRNKNKVESLGVFNILFDELQKILSTGTFKHMKVLEILRLPEKDFGRIISTFEPDLEGENLDHVFKVI